MRHHTIMRFSLLFTLLVFPCSILAQSSGQQGSRVPFTLDRCIAAFAPQDCCAAPPTQQLVSEMNSQTRQRLPLAASDVAPTASTAVALVASDKDGRGIVSFSKNTQTPRGAVNDWTLKISAPFNQSQNQSVLASLAGLSGDIVASGSFSRFIWNINPQAYGQALCQACQDAGIQDLLLCNEDDLASILRANRVATEPEIERRINALQDAMFGRVPGTVLGLEASVGRKERTFFELDGTKQEEDRSGYSFSAVSGMILQGWSTYMRLTGKTDYKENDKATFCSPITGSILENCTAQPLGEAKEVESLILATEARVFFGSLALAPSVQYDFKTDVWGFEAPLFLVRNSDGGFTGGFKLAWRSDQDDLVAAVFITKPLQP
jgi:hypothetical protein